MRQQRQQTIDDSETLPLNAFQQRILLIPERFDVAALGGRGGGKSWALAVLALRYIEQHRERARILYVRRTYKGLADFELTCRELFGKVYGKGASYNAAEHVWKFANGGYMELGQLEDAGSFAKFQGRSFGLLLVDEAGQFPDPAQIDILRSNLRGPEDVPIRVVLAANPGGAGHYWIAKRYVFKSAPWAPFFEPASKREWVHAPSTFSENEFIDREQYRSQLESSCSTDKELLRAWIEGDWTVARGAYFADVLDESRNAIDPWADLPDSMRAQSDGRGRHFDGWRLYLAHDFGSTAPSVTFVVAKSPGAKGPDGRFYPRGSLVLIDELATNKAGELNVGRGWTVGTLAEEIKTMCARWRMRPEGVADDAIFARTGHGAGSIAEEFQRFGIYFNAAEKGDRVTGWTRMKRLLADAGKPDVPGLYVSRSCEFFWQTVPYLARDPKRVEDMDSNGPDHAADAARYGCRLQDRSVKVERLRIL